MERRSFTCLFALCLAGITMSACTGVGHESALPRPGDALHAVPVHTLSIPDFRKPLRAGYRLRSGDQTFYFPATSHVVRRRTLIEVKTKGAVSLYLLDDVASVSKKSASAPEWTTLPLRRENASSSSRDSCIDPSDVMCQGSGCDASQATCDTCPDCMGSIPDGSIPQTGAYVICFRGPCNDSGVDPYGVGLYRFPNLTCALDYVSLEIDCVAENNTGAFDTNLLYGWIFNVGQGRDEAYSYTPTHTGFAPPFRAVVSFQPNHPGMLGTVFVDSGIYSDDVAYYGMPGTPTAVINIIYSTQYPPPSRNGYAGYGFGINPAPVLGG